MSNVGYATVSVIPSARGFGKAIGKQVDPELRLAGQSTGLSFGKVLKRGTLAGIAGLGAGIGLILKTGIGEALDASKGSAQLAAGIKSTGDEANVTVKGLTDLATSIQHYSGQTDDSIVKSEQLLLTFRNIKNTGPDKIFDLATVASANMAAKMGGDASEKAILLGKALNDPVKGITALHRVGVTFTDGQKAQIAALVKTGDTVGAQKVILGELNKEFGGAAIAAGKSLPGQLAIAKRSFEDVSQTIAEKILPVALPAFIGLAAIITNNLIPALVRVGLVVQAVAEFVQHNQTTFKVLGAIILALIIPTLVSMAVATVTATAATIAGNAAWIIYALTVNAMGIALKITAIATKAFTIGQWLLNAALTANPIGIVVVALAALAAGLIYAYKHSETFRNIVNSVFGFIRSHWPLLLGILTGPIGLAVLLIVKNFGRIRSAAAGVIDFFKSVPGKIKGAFGNVGSILADTGRKLIQGLINGITSKFGDVKNTLGGLTRKLTSWKGPAPLDKVILSPAGRMVIDGFITGLESRYSAVQSSLGGLTNSLGVPASPTISSRSTPSSPAGTHPIILDGMVVGYLHGMVTDVVADQANLAATTGRQHR